MCEMNIINKLARESLKEYDLQGKSLFKKKVGKCKCYYQLQFDETLDNDLQILSCLYQDNYPFRVFGMGTNLYITESGYDGLFIDISQKKSYIIFDEINETFKVSANTTVSKFVNYTMDLGYDFAALAGIPGLVGSGVSGNAGWTPSGKSISTFVKRVKVFDFFKSEYDYIMPENLEWQDRSSRIKKDNSSKMRYLICEVEFKSEKIGNEIVKEKFSNQMNRRIEYLKWGFLDGTAGSIWSNSHLIKKTGKSFPNILKESECLKCNYNGARYSENGNMYFTTEKNTRDYDVAKLLKITVDYIKNKYQSDLYMEMIILDSEGLIDRDTFINRYLERE